MSAKKRRIRFTTRTLFAVVTLLAILCAFFGARAVREVREHHATTQITRLGGRFDHQPAGILTRDGWVTRSMSFLVYEGFARVTHVSLDRTRVLDDDLAVLASLPNLEGLDISNTDITDAGVVHLAMLPNLKYINAQRTKLSEAGVNELKSHRPSLFVDWR
ncbi:MAG: hypothetical protein KDB23_20545 [Planctomycetales bacterium]|nr:hypothetical protein [Planctomycetales bacterium]